MNKLTAVIVAVCLLAGCATAPRDASTSDETALVFGHSVAWMSGCSVHGPLPVKRGDHEPSSFNFGGSPYGSAYLYVDGQISYRSLFPSLVVDAGPVKFLAACLDSDGIFGTYPFLSLFRFVAKAGHTYELSRKDSDCLLLLDVTDNDQIVACEPYIYGRYVNLSTSIETAIIRRKKGSKRNDGRYCNIRTVGRSVVTGDLLEVDAGPITVHANCNIGGNIMRHWVISKFQFDAKTGHIYTFSVPDKHDEITCISLLDVTSQESVVECVQYAEIE